MVSHLQKLIKLKNKQKYNNKSGLYISQKKFTIGKNKKNNFYKKKYFVYKYT